MTCSHLHTGPVLPASAQPSVLLSTAAPVPLIGPPPLQVDSVPVVHGSALFTRGETQSLCTATVGRRQEQQKTESLLGGESSKRLFVHYSFPAFAVGDTSLHSESPSGA
jgi:polyribonucleotide nucleotidyltransferase